MTRSEWGYWRARVERRRHVKLWGQPHIITPRLCRTVFGDGGQWMWLEPLNTRPNFYVLRVDSLLELDWTSQRWAVPRADVHDMLSTSGGILDAIQDQFGAYDDDVEDRDAEPDEFTTILPWPALDDSVGVHWGEYAPEPLTRRRARRAA